VENANVTLGGKAMRVINKWQHTKLEVHVTKIAALNVWTIS
jgi:starvation-inducible outer membrane lipoprotein